MKLANTALWLGMFVLVSAAMLTSGRPTKRKPSRRSEKTSLAQTLSQKIESSPRLDTETKETLDDDEKHRGHHRSRNRLTKKRSAKRRKAKSKRKKRKRANVKDTALADEPKIDVGITTASPAERESGFATEAALLLDPLDISARPLSNNKRLPSWVPRQLTGNCGTCAWQECPSIHAMRRYCPSGLARDECGCCVTCANGVGMPCSSLSLSPIWLPPCGDDLECVSVSKESLVLDSDPTWKDEATLEGICSCKKRTPVCASNNVTFDNLCEFREASFRQQVYTNTSVTILHQGPCRAAPNIDSAPADAIATVGNVMSFRCETSGFPLPRIQWFKRSEKKRKMTEEELPGYLSHAVTQMRGGPGKYQLTTWLTLDKVKESDGGTYVCRSSNGFGKVDGEASLSITDI